MENADPLKPGDERPTDKQEKKKPYIKPSFRYERVFEIGALVCGKVQPHEGGCHAARKSS
jgi:hypothetical protein